MIVFNNCYYRITGQKTNGKKIKTRWEKIDDRLVIFNNEDSIANWDSLTIESRRLTDPPKEDIF